MDRNDKSILGVGVPRHRGTPDHFEYDDDTAYTVVEAGGVQSIHTPQCAFRRAHELLHAIHTDQGHWAASYGHCEPTVGQIVEDCRLHLNHWHWRERETPQVIEQAARRFLRRERTQNEQHIAKDPNRRGGWGDFATMLRQAAVRIGMGETSARCLRGITDKGQRRLADQLLYWIRNGQEKRAAEWLQKIFFGGPKEPPKPRIVPHDLEDEDGEEAGRKPPEERNSPYGQPEMKVIELDHTVRIPQAKVGKRKATMGPRIHRPSLAKPILPQKLFIKKARTKPGGTILIDASGSMGDFEEVAKWAEHAPFGTIAYYAGSNSGNGWLYVYARNGRRSPEIVEPPGRQNTVDGPAIDWLLEQRGPRVMVTDREFCGAADSYAQIVRLRQLEIRKVIKVEDYRTE